MSKGSLAIGIDMGGTNTSFGIVNRNGTILQKGKMKTIGHDSFETYLKNLTNHLEHLLEKEDKAELVGIGVGAPNGNFYSGEIAHAANLPWQGVIPFAKILEEEMGMKTTITNDANAATIGEMKYGAAKGMNDFIMITLGTGVGSGIVSNGQLIYGHDGFAGEVGHIIAVRDGRKCGCGRNGCLECYTSASGIVRTAEEWMQQRDMDTVLRQHSGKLNSYIIHQAAEQKDAMALELFEFTGKILGQTLADVVAITSPEAIIFFGGLAMSGKLILAPTKKYLEQNLLNIYQNKVRLLLSALPDSDAAILGASALAW